VRFRPSRNDPVWEQALDWLFRIQAAPGDRELGARRDAWLAMDETHRQAYRQAERVWRLTGALPAAHADRWPKAVAPRSPSRRQAFGLAAGALAASVMLAAVPEAWTRMQASHRTATGERSMFPLPDGSVVHLDTGSAIAIRFTGERRGVALLEGRAFFEVVRDAARPFVVEAADVAVAVLGTAFDVNLAAETVSVSVASGAVSVTVSEGGAPAVARLAPGERLTVRRATGEAVREVVAPQAIAAWRGGRLVVDGATVAEVVAELRRYHPGLIVLRDEALGARRVTGVFDLHDPENALRAAVLPHSGRVRNPLPLMLVVDAG